MDKNLIVALAKRGSRGAGGSVTWNGGDVDDGWDAPGLTKAGFALQIIWRAVAVILLVLTIGALPRVLPLPSRRPYLCLTFVVVSLITSFVLGAVALRAPIIDNIIMQQINSATTFFDAVVDVFLPAVVLYLIHLRGKVLQEVKGNTITPVALQPWKHILELYLIASTFILYMVQLGYRADWITSKFVHPPTDDLFQQYLDVSHSLSHTITALHFLLCLDVLVSLVVHFVQSNDAGARDPVSKSCAYSFLLCLLRDFPSSYPGSTLFHDLCCQVSCRRYDPQCSDSRRR